MIVDVSHVQIDVQSRHFRPEFRVGTQIRSDSCHHPPEWPIPCHQNKTECPAETPAFLLVEASVPERGELSIEYNMGALFGIEIWKTPDFRIPQEIRSYSSGKPSGTKNRNNILDLPDREAKTSYYNFRII